MNKYLIGFLVLGVMAVAGWFLPASNPVTKQIANIGAQSVGLLDGDCLFVNGAHECYASKPMVATSSIPCAFKSPAATSTLVFFKADITKNGLSTELFDLSTSTSAFGSSTPAFISLQSVTTATDNTFMWLPNIATTSSPGGVTNVLPIPLKSGINNDIIGPNTWLTMRIATNTPGTYASYWTGTCSASFRY